MAHIRKNILINAPVEKVYAFARDPKRWNTWWTGLSEPQEITGTGDVGTVVKHNYTMAGMTFPVISRVLEDKPSPRQGRWRGEFNGPITGEHTWTYTANGPKTEVIVDIAYTVPGKLLGVIANKLVIERLQEQAMQHTIENLKLVCEAEVEAKVYA